MARYVDIPLDRSRRVRFTINGIRELERYYGSTFGQLFAEGNLGFDQIIQMLTVGLKYGESEKRPLTDTQVGELVDKKWLDNGKDLGELVDILMEALQASGIVAKKEVAEEEEDDHQSVGGRKDLPNV